jgi:hypothetical protein
VDLEELKILEQVELRPQILEQEEAAEGEQEAAELFQDQVIRAELVSFV